MKKFCTGLLCAALVLSLAGCAESTTGTVTNSTTASTQNAVADSTVASTDEAVNTTTAAETTEEQTTQAELAPAEAAQSAADELASFNGLDAGLYDLDHNLTYSWDELKSSGMLTVEAGSLKVVDQSIEGALVISDEVTTIPENGVIGQLSYVVLPDSVTSIDSYGLCGCLRAVDIPDSVTDLGAALIWVDTLLWARLPAGLTEIHSGMFAHDTNLVTVILPDAVTAIGTNAFLECYSLENLSIPKTVTTIGDYAFIGCTFADFSLPEGLEELGDRAFEDCKGVTNVVIPASLVTFPAAAFTNCDIESIRVAEDHPMYDSREDCNAVIWTAQNDMIMCCKNTVIPESVTRISCVFNTGDELTSLTIPGKVTYINKNLVANSQIKTIYVYDEDTQQVVADALAKESDNADVEVILVGAGE